MRFRAIVGGSCGQVQTIRQMSSVWLWEAVQRVLTDTFEIFCIEDFAFPCKQRSLTMRQTEITRGERPLPASDELFNEAADQISDRNLRIFKTGFV